MTAPNNSFLLEAAWNALPAEISRELYRILDYWDRQTADQDHGGFYGKIDQQNRVHAHAPKGSVLNARILWAFSAAYQYTKNPRHLELATRAYEYIRDYLTDAEMGGLFWTVDHEGQMLDGHKQIYAQAFGIYGMSEYYRASKEPAALDLAFDWYQLIEKYSRDSIQGGYIDAFSRNWGFLDDKRLSEKDENAPKTMNTHLHVVEAYANLYEVFPLPALKEDIEALLSLFNEKIIIPGNYHLGLFFSANWKMDATIVSYGHDIEAAWLLQSNAESIDNPALIQLARKNALHITGAAMQGLDRDGGLWYEYHTVDEKRILEKHWWPQAEALVGFCNAWQLTQNSIYKNALLKSWRFIRDRIFDIQFGEWHWGIDAQQKPMTGQDKMGLWKCPYHNVRACLELLERLKA